MGDKIELFLLLIIFDGNKNFIEWFTFNVKGFLKASPLTAKQIIKICLIYLSD